MFSKLQAKNIISRMMKSLETGIPNYTTRSYLTMYGQGQEVGGFTFPFANHIVVRRTSSFKKITSLKDIRRLYLLSLNKLSKSKMVNFLHLNCLGLQEGILPCNIMRQEAGWQQLSMRWVIKWTMQQEK